MSTPFTRNANKGFTLIELLIAVVVGIILLGGLVQIFILTKNNYRIQQGLNYMQENLRFAMGEVGYSARMGGFFYTVSQPRSVLATSAASVFGSGGGAASAGAVQSANELTVLPGLTATPGCGMISWTVGIQGVNSTSARPPCIAAANHVAGTDMLFVSYLRPVFLGLPAITTPAIATGGGAITQPATNVANVDIFDDGIYAIVFDPGSKGDVTAKQGGLIGTGTLLTAPIRAASLFYSATETDKIIANNIGNGGPVNLIKRSAAMMPVQLELYYVRPCSVLEAGESECRATSDGGNPQPTLMRSNVVPGAAGGARSANDEAIVSGIEQFQLEYLASGCSGYLNAVQIAAGTNCVPTAFTPEQRWQRVINIRIAMVARSNERANERDLAVYPLSTDTTAYTAATNITQLPANDRYIRRTMISFAQPRNALRPLPPVNP